jgi:hypothetical protein
MTTTKITEAQLEIQREKATKVLQGRARYMGVDSVEFFDSKPASFFTVEVGGQEDDIIITRETAEYLWDKLGWVLGKEQDA